MTQCFLVAFLGFDINADRFLHVKQLAFHLEWSVLGTSKTYNDIHPTNRLIIAVFHTVWVKNRGDTIYIIELSVKRPLHEFVDLYLLLLGENRLWRYGIYILEGEKDRAICVKFMYSGCSVICDSPVQHAFSTHSVRGSLSIRNGIYTVVWWGYFLYSKNERILAMKAAEQISMFI